VTRALVPVSFGVLMMLGGCQETGGAVATDSGDLDVVATTPCPSAEPAHGSACEGAASCPYGQACSQTISVCTGGFWLNSPADITDGGECPATAPDPGADCTLCPSSGPCTYDANCEGDRGESATASCQAGAWSVTQTPCAHEGGIPEGGLEASSDAGDARADGPAEASADGAAGDGGDAGKPDAS
jgi:hypothetical protein